MQIQQKQHQVCITTPRIDSPHGSCTLYTQSVSHTHSSEVGNVDADSEVPLVPDRHHGHRHPVLLPVPPVEAAAVEQGLRALEHARRGGVDDLHGFLRGQLIVLREERHAAVGGRLLGRHRCWEEEQTIMGGGGRGTGKRKLRRVQQFCSWKLLLYES